MRTQCRGEGGWLEGDQGHLLRDVSAAYRLFTLVSSYPHFRDDLYETAISPKRL